LALVRVVPGQQEVTIASKRVVRAASDLGIVQ
jgi:hypothetical protein